MLEPKRFILTLLIGVFLACGWAHAEDYNGTFLITGSDGTITLTLLQDKAQFLTVVAGGIASDTGWDQLAFQC